MSSLHATRSIDVGRIENALQTLKITLSGPPGAVANYLPVRITGSLAFVSGQIPMAQGQLLASGPVPSVVTPDAARAAARQCVINGLAALRQALDGDLDRIEGVIRLGVFVASDPGFYGQPTVADGASELLVELWGDAGRHARAAVGCVALPLGATVEVELVVALSRNSDR
jgi:enamine deaminase RidA (YjgF/YER057c/UK114 family)